MRRIVAALVAGAAVATFGPTALFARTRAPRPRIALTFDDLPRHAALPPGATRMGVVRAIVDALAARRAPAIGFVNGVGIGNADERAAIAAWRAARLPLGNHTYGHVSLDRVGAAAFLADVDRNAPSLPRADERRWFRYPFLSEGRDPAARAAVRAGLHARGYRVAAVTMSFGDYAWNDVYARCAARGDAGRIAALEASYLAAAATQAIRARALAHDVLGRDIPYVLLMHAGAFDARMLPRLLDLYASLGFEFTTLAAAQADPFYAGANDVALPGPSPTLEAAAVAKGVAVPPDAPLPDAATCG